MKKMYQNELKTACNIQTILLALLLILSSTAITTAEQLVMEYNFDRPEIQSVILTGESYDRVIMLDAPRSGNIGQPALPAAGGRILLPAGTEVENIVIEYTEKIFLGDGYNIEPVLKPVKLSSMNVMRV